MVANAEGPAASTDAVAVMVVHGIGEQLPMDTLRSFVDGLFPELGNDPSPDDDPDDDVPAVLVKQDRLSSGFDLRRLSVRKNRQHPKVDFYECYWASTFSAGSVGAVLSFARRFLLDRRAGRHPQMRTVLAWARGLAVVVGVVVGVIFFAGLLDDVREGWKRWAGSALGGLAVGFVATALSHVVTHVLADATRYFRPSPADLDQRDAARTRALDMLLRLHSRAEGVAHYDRVVVVGHSLGSVIAYEALCRAWDALRHPVDPVDPDAPVEHDEQPALRSFLTGMASELGADPTATPTEAQVLAFQDRQRALHREQRGNRVPWSVTDFVTLGSPLTHAADLLGSRRAEFDQRVAQNELAVLPPVAIYQRRLDRLEIWNDDPACPGRALAHETSVFASTRWTNLYVPMTRALGGDLVGGPLQPTFGRGILDVPVRLSSSGWRRRVVMAIPTGAHTRYWKLSRPWSGISTAKDVRGRRDSVSALTAALHLQEDWGGVENPVVFTAAGGGGTRRHRRGEERTLR